MYKRQVPESETYSFSLTGDDASKFVLSSATGNDSDTHYIYLNTVFDHENPTDVDSNNVYGKVYTTIPPFILLFWTSST